MSTRSGDDIANWLREDEAGAGFSKSRVFKFDTLREARLTVTKHADSGGNFFSISLSRLPIEVAADIATLFENCRSEP